MRSLHKVTAAHHLSTLALLVEGEVAVLTHPRPRFSTIFLGILASILAQK